MPPLDPASAIDSAYKELMDKRVAFLVDATVHLASSLDYATTLRGVASSTVPVLGDFCFFDVLTPDGTTLERLAWAHVDPVQQAAFDLIAPLIAKDDVIVRRVLQTGVTEILVEDDESWVQRAGESPEYLQFLHDLRFHTLLVVPLTAHDSRVGALTLGLVDRGRQYDESDRLLADQLARIAALAVYNAILHRREQRLRQLAEAAEVRFAGLFDGVSDAVLVLDDQSRVVEANAMATTLFGYSQDEFRQLRFGDLSPGDATSQHDRDTVFANLQSTGAHLGESPLLRKNRSSFFGEMRAYPIALPNGTVYLTTIRDVTSRKEQERHAAALKREHEARNLAEQLVRERDAFLSVAAHELRTPVTSIRGYADLLMRAVTRGGVQPDRLNRYVTNIHAGTERLVTLIHDLLDVSQLHVGQFVVRLMRIDLVALVEQVSSAFAGQLPAQYTLVFEEHPAAAWVDGDSGRLEQVLANLLNNAVKYAPSGGTITLAIVERDGGVAFSIQDEGVGIPVESLNSIFMAFLRASNVRADQYAGLGLGLFIAKQIVDAHGGRLWADSPGAGRGATFSMWLPASRSA